MMAVNTAFFVFDVSLDFFLPLSRRGRPVMLDFQERQSVKHLIESLGVPHTEVGKVLIGGQEHGLQEIAQDGDLIEVRAPSPGRPVDPRFLLDSHLGRLAAYLLMCGLDCLYANNYEDSQIAEILGADPRILLSRDRRLLMRKAVWMGYCLRSLEPAQQLREVIRRFDLFPILQPFHRCLHCNGLLERVEKAAILDRLEPKTRLYYDEFAICRTCDQVYWKGSHWKRMQHLVTQIIQENQTSEEPFT